MIKVADYKDVDCKGCTCCFVTMIGQDDCPLCDECEFHENHPEFQVECTPNKCNMFKSVMGRLKTYIKTYY